MRKTSWMWAVALAGIVACGGEEEGERIPLGGQQQAEQPTGRESWSPELTARIDSANTAYAAGEYETAAEIFSVITDEQPELGVAWFGLSMAQRAMGDTEAADESLMKAERYAPGLGRMHQAATDSASKVEIPSGHPPMGGGEDEGGAETGGSEM